MAAAGSAHELYRTAGAPADEAARLERIGESAQRKASLRLLPMIAVGYGLSYMDRINISFASLADEPGPAFQRFGLRIWRGNVFHRVCAVRGAVEPDAAALRGKALAGAHHVDLGIAGRGNDVRAHAARIQRVAVPAGHGGGRILSPE